MTTPKLTTDEQQFILNQCWKFLRSHLKATCLADRHQLREGMISDAWYSWVNASDFEALRHTHSIINKLAGK